MKTRKPYIQTVYRKFQQYPVYYVHAWFRFNNETVTHQRYAFNSIWDAYSHLRVVREQWEADND
jgi:hypothetical protein